MKKLCVLLVLLSVNAISSEISSEQEINLYLDHYCGAQKYEFQEQVIVGEGRQVLHHQGPFMQVNSSLPSKIIKQAFSHSMQQAELSHECSEYLLSYAEVVDDEVDNQIFARVLFNFDQYSLTTRSKFILRNITEKLEKQKETLVLNGHTDSKGSDSYNMTLGLARSHSVSSFLHQQGVSQEWLESHSFGEEHPVDDNRTLEGQHHNRRVDIEKNKNE